eukprot:116570-Chlamydomonas_euryale.AAC.9
MCEPVGLAAVCAASHRSEQRRLHILATWPGCLMGWYHAAGDCQVFWGREGWWAGQVQCVGAALGLSLLCALCQSCTAR